ncbi:MAG TPA: hypothetical protein VEQ59_01460 [Polyangiaceae bacterium]|nr:hypothetical protein [Polyangiaceae bacterium]
MEPAPPPTAEAAPPVSPPSVPPSGYGAGSGVDPKRRQDRLIGLVIVAASFMVCLALSFWAKEKSRPEVSEPPGPPTIEGVVGYPREVDALASLTAARKLTRRPALRGIVLDGVQNDNGIINVTEGPGRARFTFQSEAGQGAQPPREPGTLPKRVTCGRQDVVLQRGGLVAEPDQADYPCPPGPVEALPDPECTTRTLWRLARRRHVPTESLAHIEYYRSKAGPAWRFEVLGTPHHFTMYGDCKRELSAADAVGAAP